MLLGLMKRCGEAIVAIIQRSELVIEKDSVLPM